MPLRVQFQTKYPKAHTAWLFITGPAVEFPPAEQPGGLIHDLINEAGWKKSPIPPAPADCDGNMDIDLVKDGTDLFNSWTPAEKLANMAAARKVLVRHGYPKGMKIRLLTLGEML